MAWLTAFAAAVLVAALPAVGKETPPPRTLDELKDAVRKIVVKGKVPGVGFAVVRREGIVWAGGFGKADIASGKDVTADTHFRVGSVSKTFVAVALMKLAEERKLDLNARLADLAPELEIRNPWESSHPVRVIHVLEHTAGFDDMHFNEAYNLHDPPDMPLREVLAKNPRSRVVRWPPGTRMSYSNPGYGIAGYLIEKVSGKPYEQYIQNVVFEPVGMTQSSFRLDDDSRKRLATGYDGHPSRPVEWLPIYLRPSGNLNSSPREMAMFIQMLLNRGRAVRDFLRDLRDRKVNRSTLGEDYNIYLTDERIAAAAQTLARNEPAQFEPPVLSERGGMEVSRTRFKLGHQPMLALMYRTKDGKIQQFLFFRQ